MTQINNAINKKLIRIILTFCLVSGFNFIVTAQTPYLMGVTNKGGVNNGMGTAFTYNLNTSSFEQVAETEGFPGVPEPTDRYARIQDGAVFLASDGLYYVTTHSGGTYGKGILFSYDHGTGEKIILHHFEQVSGANPVQDLVEESGKLYGLTFGGGSTYDNGVFYEWEISTGTYSVIAEFDYNTTGSVPSGPLMKHSNGKYYGLNRIGAGSNKLGALYSIDIGAGVISKIRAFNSLDQGPAIGGIVEDGDGNIIVTVTNMGDGVGGILHLDKDTGFDNGVSYAFNASQAIDFGMGMGGIYKGPDGNHYIYSSSAGMNGYGCLIRYNISNKHFGTVHHFSASDNGEQRFFGPLRNFNGSMYAVRGTDVSGGSFVEINVIDGSYESTLIDYGSQLVDSPSSAFHISSSSEMLGIATYKGKNGVGGLYSNDISNGFKVQIDFGTKEGVKFTGGLVTDNHGKFYGVAKEGGIYYKGVLGGLNVEKRVSFGSIFEYDIRSQKTTLVHAFDALNGQEPLVPPTLASNGKLYGLVRGWSGSYLSRDFAVLYELDPETHSYVVLNDDFGIEDGIPSDSYSAVIESTSGTLHFTTKRGIYEYVIATNTKTLVYSDANSYPKGQSLMKATNGNLYGTMIDGSAYTGFLYSFDPSVPNAITQLHSFGGGANGTDAKGVLVEAANGKLYGTTYEGGANDKGIVFSWDIGGGTFANLHDFGAAATDGANPTGGFLEASDGKLYAMTENGGANNLGILYELNTTGDVFSKLEDLTEQTGGGGLYSTLIEHDVESNANLSSLTTSEGVLKPLFNNAVLSYTVDVPDDVAGVPTISATASHASANVNITQATNVTGTLPERTGTVLVTAEDAVTTKTFEVVFNQVGTDATLASLTVSVGTLNPSFNASILAYTDTLTDGTIAIPTVTAVPTDAGATVAIQYANNLTGSESERTTNIVVLAEDSATTKVYSIVYFVEKIEPPTNLVVSRSSASTSNLSWVDNADNEEGYKIEMKATSETAFVEIATVAADVTIYDVLSLDCDLTYTFRVRAYYSSFVSEYSNESVAGTYSYEFTVDGTPLSQVTQPLTTCDGDVIELEAPPNLKYVWSTTQTSQLIEVRSSGTYSLKVGDDNCFADNGETIEIIFNTLPNKPAILVEGNTLTASDADSYKWYFGTIELPETTKSILAIETGFYSVEVTNTNNCSALSDEISVKIGTDPPTGKLIVASEGFSPNGDGINDTWNIDLIDNYQNNQVQILNRSGAIVFEKTGYENDTNAFEGIANVSTVGTNVLAEGTYFYVIDLGDGQDKISGYFTLLR